MAADLHYAPLPVPVIELVQTIAQYPGAIRITMRPAALVTVPLHSP